MMKKNEIIKNVFLLGALMMLTACGNTNHTEDNNSQTSEADTHLSSTGYMIDNFSEQSLDLTKYSIDYKLETDDQLYFLNNKATKSEHGYYYSKLLTLMFWDMQSKREVPLCNQADCSHTTSDCNANFSNMDYGYNMSNLQYYEGSIYFVGYDMEGYTTLFKIAADASSREKYMDLYKADLSTSNGAEGQTHWSAPEFCLHRGYVYFIDGKENQPKLRRMKLGSTEAEVIFESAGDHPDVYRILGYGDYIFFQAANDIYEGENRVSIEGGIFAYNTQTEEIQLIKKDVIATYVIEGNTLYYQSDGIDTKVQSLDLVTQEEKLVLDNADTTVWSVDEHYIYKFSDGLLFVYDHEGNPICEVTTEIDSCYFGDGTYLIGEKYDAEKEKSITCIIEVSDFADGQADWIFVE